MTASGRFCLPLDWVKQPPAAFDIVTCWFPEEEGEPGPKLRPALVTKVFQSGEDFALEVAFGTKHLKWAKRRLLDLFVQNHRDIDAFGLARATRFDLDLVEMLPWDDEFFGCWTGKSHPKIGTLTETYIRDFAFLMMVRSQYQRH